MGVYFAEVNGMLQSKEDEVALVDGYEIARVDLFELWTGV